MISVSRSPAVFISYRRSDSQTITERIHDRLGAQLGAGAVFKDIGSIPAGADFRQHIRTRLGSAKVMLVIVGPDWANAVDEAGRRRLQDPQDLVRLEVAGALQRSDMRVIPVLVLGARMPEPEDLPEDLRPLCFRNNLPVRNDPDFDGDVDRLLDAIAEATGRARARSGSTGRRWHWIATGGMVVLVLGCGLLWAIGTLADGAGGEPIWPTEEPWFMDEAQLEPETAPDPKGAGAGESEGVTVGALPEQAVAPNAGANPVQAPDPSAIQAPPALPQNAGCPVLANGVWLQAPYIWYGPDFADGASYSIMYDPTSFYVASDLYGTGQWPDPAVYNARNQWLRLEGTPYQVCVNGTGQVFAALVGP